MLTEAQLLYVEVLRRTLSAELQFFLDVVEGRAQARTTFRDELKRRVIQALRIATPVVDTPITEALIELGNAVFEKLDPNEAKKEDGLYGRLSGLSRQVTIEVDTLARNAACGWDHWLNHYLADEDSVILFAVVGATRVMSYLTEENCRLDAQHMFLGLLRGRSGSGFEGANKNHYVAVHRKGIDGPMIVRDSHTAEGAYGRTGLVNADGVFHIHANHTQDYKSIWARLSRRLGSGQTSHCGFASFESRAERQKMSADGKKVKYPYVQVTNTILEAYQHPPFGYVPHHPAAQFRRWFTQEVHSRLIPASYIQEYADSLVLEVPNLPLHNWLQQKLGTPHAVQAVYHGEISGTAQQRLDLSQGMFPDVNFSGATLRHCSLGDGQRAYFASALWEDVSLEGKHLDATNLNSATLRRVDLRGSRLLNTQLVFARLESCNLANTIRDGLVFESDSDLWDEASKDSLGEGARWDVLQAQQVTLAADLSLCQQQVTAFDETFTAGIQRIFNRLNTIESTLEGYNVRQRRDSQRIDRLENDSLLDRNGSVNISKILWALFVAFVAVFAMGVSSRFRPDKKPIAFRANAEPIWTWNLPHALPPELFLERLEPYKNLTRQLTLEQPAHLTTMPAKLTILHGMPGSGKTELAKHIINYPPRPDYCFRGWFLADTRPNLLSEYQRMVQDLRWSNQTLGDDALIRLVKEQFAQSSYPGWLLVYDNADNVTMVEELLPSHGGQIVLTSRRNAWKGRNVQLVEVGLLTATEGVELLGRRRRRIISSVEQVDAQALVTELGYLPLAITQAGAYLSKQPVSIAEYHQQLKEYPQLLADKSLGGQANQAVATTWHLSLQALEAQAEHTPVYRHAQEVLKFCAYLRAEGIPKGLLAPWLAHRKLKTKRFGFLSNVPLMSGFFEKDKETLELELQILVEGLVDYALLSWEEEGQTLSMHRLLQTVLRAEHEQAFSVSQQQAYWEKWLNLFLEEFQVEWWWSNYRETLRYHEQLVAHGEQVLEYLKKHQGISEARWTEQLAGLKYYFGENYYATGQFTKARHYWEQALTMRRAAHGERAHPAVAVSLHNLGRTYQALDELARAKDYLAQSLAMCRKLYGERAHPDVAASLHSLGHVYQALGEWARAKDYYEQSLMMYRELHGERAHPDVATLLNNLGMMYREFGGRGFGEDYLAQASAMEQALRKRDTTPSIASSLRHWLLGTSAKQAEATTETEQVEATTETESESYPQLDL